MKKKTRLIPLKTLIKYNSFLRGSNRRSRFGNNDMCSICMEDCNNSEDIHTTSCNHKFHSGCINSWFGPTRMTCPNCRAPQTEVPTRQMPYNVRQRTNINLLDRFNEVYTPPSSPPRPFNEINGLSPEAQRFFEEHGFIPASMMRDDYPDPFDSPHRNPPTRRASGSRNHYF